ncbi:MAG TPA: hypothetical protein VFH61_15650, partial [Thermoleophilia bacterium]|nr:hypothetical protein [Thermoleophilia bacterium]
MNTDETSMIANSTWGALATLLSGRYCCKTIFGVPRNPTISRRLKLRFSKQDLGAIGFRYHAIIGSKIPSPGGPY